MMPKAESQDMPANERPEAGDSCPECGSLVKSDSSRGESVCSACGLVTQDNAIDYGPEWRAFDSEQAGRRARTGSPLTESLHDRGLATMFTRSSRDANGKLLPATKRLELARMRRLHTRATLGSGGKRNIATAIREINRMAEALSIPRPVSDQAIHLYRRATREDLIRGRSIDSMSAAALYAAARQAGVPREPKQVAVVSRIDTRTLLRTYRTLAHAFNLTVPVTDARQYLPRFASELKLPPKVESRARELLEAAEKKRLASGRSPAALAASALYVASHLEMEPRTQKAIAEATGITEVTVRSRGRELATLADVDLTAVRSQSASGGNHANA